MDFSDGASTCAGASLVADSSVESLTKVKDTAPCNGGNSAPSRLHCGPFSVYKKAANLGFCVCAPTSARPSPTCLSSQDYSHGFSSRFQIRGPDAGQTWQAQLSVGTTFTLAGTGFSGSDKLIVLEKQFSPTCREFESNSASGNVMSQHVVNFGTVRDSGTADTQSVWNSVIFNKVAEFIVCWCGADRQTCSDSSQYRTYAGQISVNGPSSADHVVVLGQSTSIQLTGVGLKPTDRIRIVHGSNRAEPGGNGAGTNIGDVAAGADAGPTFLDAAVTPVIAAWGGVQITSAGTYSILPEVKKRFKICWCGKKAIDSNGCGNGHDSEFNVNAGSIVVSGPNQGGSFTPRMGLPFSVTVTGQGMHDGDRVILTDQACGSTKTDAGGVYAGPKQAPDESTEIRNIWHNVIITERKQYRLCWCARAGISCDRPEEFLAQVALYLPLGVDNSPAKLLDLNVVKGMPFKIELTGATASSVPVFFSYSKLRILRANQVATCGALGSSDLIAAVVQNVYTACNKDEHYNTYVGKITVSGITTRTTPWICSQKGGGDCKVTIISAKPTLNDKIRVIAKGASNGCGLSERADPTAFTLGTQVAPTRLYNVTTVGGVQTGQQALEYNFGEASKTGSYDVCYCQDYGGCAEHSHFFQLAGTISIGGVSGAQENQFCFTGQDCTSRIVGTLLDGGARMLLLDGSQPEDSCGKAGKLVLSHHFLQREQVNFQTPALYGFRGNKGTLGASVDFLDFTLGEPEVVGTYMLCYCDHELTPQKVCEYQEYYTQFAGKLYVRGIDTSLAMACEQGGECVFPVVGAVMTPADRVMAIAIDFDDTGKDITPDDKRCGGINAVPAADSVFSPGNTIAPQNIDLNVLTLNGKSRANYKFSRVNNPGKFRLCFCPGIPGSVSSVCESPPQFRLSLGTVRIQGVISDVRAGILPTNKVVTVQVESTVPGSRIGCVATLESMYSIARPPDLNDLAYCEDLTINRGTSESPESNFPLCVGRTENTELTITGWNDVNIEIRPEMVEIARRKLPGGNTPNWYVWCYSASACSSNRCVMPQSPSGMKITQTNSDSPYVQDHTQTTMGSVAEKVNVGIKVDNPTATIAAAARLKIVDPNEQIGSFRDRVSNNLAAANLFGLTSSRQLTAATSGSAVNVTQLHPCEKYQLAAGVSAGLTCGTKGSSKCEPAGTHDVVGGKISWPNIEMSAAGVYNLCYCDRHRDDTCLQWISVGDIKVDGPFPNAPTQYGNPGVSARVAVQGLALSNRDRIHVVGGSSTCGSASVGTGDNAPSTQAPVDNGAAGALVRRRQLRGGEEQTESIEKSLGAESAERRALALVWTSAAPVVHNSSYLAWDIALTNEARYRICWCPGTLKSCTEHAHYDHFAGYLEIATRVDCEMSEFWIVEACSVPCGGGIKKKRRRITQPPKGGGTACPSNAEALISEICNANPCPVLEVSSVTPIMSVASPSGNPLANHAFQLQLKGQYFNPVEDKVMLIVTQENKQPTVAMGRGSDRILAYIAAAACDFVGSDMETMTCGDGRLSITVPDPRAVRVCVCDASAALLRNSDGSGFTLVGNMEMAGAFAAGCASPLHFLLGGSLLTVQAAGSPSSDDELVAGMAPGLFAFLMVLLSMLVGAPAGYYYYKKYYLPNKIAKKLMQDPFDPQNAKYLKQVDPYLAQYASKFGGDPNNPGAAGTGETNTKTGTAPEKPKGLLARAANFLGLTNGEKEELSEDDENQAMLMAWDEYYQSLGYPAGTAWTVLGPQLNGTGPAPQAGAQIALANGAYDPDDIFGGYGPGRGGNAAAQPPQPGMQMMALPYDGMGTMASGQMSDFLDQSFTDNGQSRSPAAGNQPRKSPLSSFVDKVRRASVQMVQKGDIGESGTDGASPASSQPVTPRAGAANIAEKMVAPHLSASELKEKEKAGVPGSTGSTSTAATAQQLLPPLVPRMSQAPPPVNLPVVGLSSGKTIFENSKERTPNKKTNAPGDEELSNGSFLSNSPGGKSRGGREQSPIAKLSSVNAGSSPASNSRGRPGSANKATGGLGGLGIEEDELPMSPKSARRNEEKRLLDEKEKFLKEQMAKQEQALEAEQKTREEIIRSKLSTLKESRAQSAGRSRLDNSMGGSGSASGTLPTEMVEAARKADEERKAREAVEKEKREKEEKAAAEQAQKEKEAAERAASEKAAAEQKRKEAEEAEAVRRQQEDEDRRRKALEAAAEKKRQQKEEAAKRAAEEKARKLQQEEEERAAKRAALIPNSPAAGVPDRHRRHPGR
eukprot:g10780.t1